MPSYSFSWNKLNKNDLELKRTADFPKHDPLLEVQKRQYEVGERIYANCSFGPSMPAANLTWFINSNQVSFLFSFNDYFLNSCYSQDSITLLCSLLQIELKFFHL